MNAPVVNPNPNLNALVERIGRVVRDRGDVELVVMLDQIMDKETEPERTAALAAVVRTISQSQKKTGN
jgi:hypothetical protein